MAIPLSAFQNIQVSSGLAAPLSGFTFVSPFSCVLVKEAEYTEAAITSEYTLLWWFGDSNYSTQYSPTHIYNWPGVYEIKLQIFETNDKSNNLTLSTTVTASNFVNDTITWDYTSWSSAATSFTFNGYQSCKTGDNSGPIPLTLNYTTSITDPSLLTFTFYAENSRSQPWTQVQNSQLASLRPRWRFTTASAGDFEQDVVFSEYTPASSTEIRLLSSGALSLSGTVVGLSGSIDFYYIDDMPSMVVNSTTGSVSANPTVIWITLDTTNISNYQEHEYSSVPSYSNSLVSLSSYFYVQTLTADHLNITLNGEVPFYNTYWPYVESRLVVTVNSRDEISPVDYMSNKILYNYPLINAVPIVQWVGLSTDTSTVLSATFNSTLSSNAPDKLEYNLSLVDNLGRNIGGYYISTFTPLATSTCVLAASTTNVITTAYDMASAGEYNPYTLGAYSTTTYNTLYLSGTSSIFNVVDFNSTYFTRKFNGNFDYGALLKQYALQPTIAQNAVFFDDYLTAIAGTSATNEDTFGGVVYEKIANFVPNTSDPTTANVDQFYALTNLLGLTLDNYNYNIPPTLSRIFDLYSAQQSVVWGARSQFARNFANSTGHTNLGTLLSAYSFGDIVSAGQKIVVQDLFKSNYYELLEVPAITSYASITARNLEYLFDSNIGLSAFPLTAYSLSSFFGWGLQTPVASFYRFFVYDSTISNQQQEGLVNWDDPYTALSELSGADHLEWVKDEGILENIFNYYIHKGLGLIND